jgi:hypothetical protein
MKADAEQAALVDSVARVNDGSNHPNDASVRNRTAWPIGREA